MLKACLQSCQETLWTSFHRECHQIVEAKGRKDSSDAKTEEGDVRQASKLAESAAGGEDLDSGAT